MTQVEYLQKCIRNANGIVKGLGVSLHWDENFNPEKLTPEAPSDCEAPSENEVRQNIEAYSRYRRNLMKIEKGDELKAHSDEKGYIAICIKHMCFLEGTMRLIKDGDIFVIDTSEMYCDYEEDDRDNPCRDTHQIIEVRR